MDSSSPPPPTASMVVAFYLLVRLESVIKELRDAVTVLTVVVARQGDVDYAEVKGLVEGEYR